MLYPYERRPKMQKNMIFGVFSSPGQWPPFCRKCPFYALKRAQNSEFAYYASKSGKWRKRKPTPPLWGDVGVKKWSQFLDSGTRSTTFGHLKIGTFEYAQKIIFFCIFGRHSYRYNIYQVRMEFRKLFDILVRPNGHEQLTAALETTKRKNLHWHILTGCPWNHLFGANLLKSVFLETPCTIM